MSSFLSSPGNCFLCRAVFPDDNSAFVVLVAIALPLLVLDQLLCCSAQFSKLAAVAEDLDIMVRGEHHLHHARNNRRWLSYLWVMHQKKKKKKNARKPP